MSKSNKKKALQSAKQYAANKDKQYQIKEVLDVRFNTITGVKQYKIQWVPCEGKTWQPTWEPEQLLGKVALMEFFKQKKKSKQLKEKKKEKKKKQDQQKIIKEYESRLNAEIELFQKKRGVSYQKIKQIRQNRNRSFETILNKSQISLDQKKNDQTRKSTSLQTYDFLIDKIIRPHNKEHQQEYFEVLLKPTGQKRYVSQFTLTKFFPNAFMKYLEEQQFQANQNFNKFRKVQNNQNFIYDNQFQLQMQKARRQNRCMIQIQEDPQIKAKYTTQQQPFFKNNQQNVKNIFQQSESIANQKVFNFQQNKVDQLKKISNKDQITVSQASNKTQKNLNISTDSKTNSKRKKTNNSLQKIDKEDFSSMFQNEKNQNLYYSDED